MSYDLDNLHASDTTGEAVIANITGTRAIASTTIAVDSVDNWPANFIAVTGDLNPSGYIDESTVTIFTGHVSGSDLEIDGFEAGYSDVGNSIGQVVIVKMTTGWADRVASALDETKDRLGADNPVKFVVSATEPPPEAGITIVWFEPL